MEIFDTRGLPFMMSVLEGVTEKQTKKGRLREFYRTSQFTQLPTADKGEGIKTSTNFADVIYGSPRRYYRHLLQTEDTGPVVSRPGRLKKETISYEKGMQSV